MSDSVEITPEEQQANAFLRERFLSNVISLCKSKKKCEINMYENTIVKGDIKAVDLNFDNILIENLETPLPNTLKVAVLRSSDVLSISYE
ncbi:unnamed protein product [Phyllotreta striolata]|uniref:Gem-associated protein 7 n=1 Tax=Phyllotreta striolata TaxID=444603 RepID=A0A9N9TJ11_PHYSR|nr:unnamed protein product [Phyllotreta striolata]